jgi:hypothetical protein
MSIHMCQIWLHLQKYFFPFFRTYLNVVLPADGNQNARRSGSSMSLPVDLWKYPQPGNPHELQMTPRSVTKDKYLRKEYRIYFRAVLEVLQDTHSLNLTCLPMDVRLFQFLRICLVMFLGISRSAAPQHINSGVPRVRIRCQRTQSLCPPCPRGT